MYKVHPRASNGWQNFNACTFGVSVTSPNWQGAKFEATLGWAARHFKLIRIDVTDALYRHNYMAEGMTPDQALNVANAQGALWLAAHDEILKSCPVPVQIVRWAEWYQHPDYQKTLDGFHAAYEASPVLREAVDADVTEFFRRKETPPAPQQIKGSRNYLLEELAVITLQARELASAKIYPGDELNCLRVVRAGLVPEAPKGLEREHFTMIKFRSRAKLSKASAG